MQTFAANIPGGTRDRLPTEMAPRRRLEHDLRGLLTNFGYGEIETPTIEYYSTFLRAEVPLAEDELFKMSGGDGRIVVLRPDATTPAARMYATKMSGICRMFYVQKVFNMTPPHRGLKVETTQAGAELIGAGGKSADLEMLALAVSALSECNGDGCRIEIGHAGLFRELVAQLDGGEAVSEELRQLMERKNYAALGDLLSPFSENPASAALLKLVKLFGAAEVLEQAEEVALTAKAAEYVAYLGELYDGLRGAGYAGYITFDLGLVNRIDYYTGITFQGYAEGVGEPVLLGGRYDGLTERFGVASPAIGWSLDIDAVCKGCTPEKTNVIVWYSPENLGKAIEYIRKCSNAELSLFESRNATIEYARKIGVSVVMLFDGETSEKVTV